MVLRDDDSQDNRRAKEPKEVRTRGRLCTGFKSPNSVPSWNGLFPWSTHVSPARSPHPCTKYDSGKSRARHVTSDRDLSSLIIHSGLFCRVAQAWPPWTVEGGARELLVRKDSTFGNRDLRSRPQVPSILSSSYSPNRPTGMGNRTRQQPELVRGRESVGMGYIGHLADNIVFIAGGGLVRNWIAVEVEEVEEIEYSRHSSRNHCDAKKIVCERALLSRYRAGVMRRYAHVEKVRSNVS
jgi:hypothetical protein